jgi:guanylate kinase
MLSPSVQERLDTARVLQLQYRPNTEITTQLRTKTLAMVVAPTASGKSFLMRQIAERDPESGRVRDFTTRPPREDDQPGAFEYQPHDDAHVSEYLDKIHRQEVVQYMVHPTTGMLYGSELSGYPAKYNFLETISNVVTVLRLLPFEHTVVIGVVVELEQWKQWFMKRYPEQTTDRTKRLQEAVTSLEWLTDVTHADLIHWVINSADRDAAATMIDIVKMGSRGDDGRDMALDMLQWARNELSTTL